MKICKTNEALIDFFFENEKDSSEHVRRALAVTQGIGDVPTQYRTALRLFNAVKAQLGNRVVVAGHSLGGGIASYVSANAGVVAYTFNPAGLHRTNQGKSLFSIRRPELINAYQVPGDVLGSVQNSHTITGNMAPNTYGRLKVLKYSGGGNPVYRHSIKRFLNN